MIKRYIPREATLLEYEEFDPDSGNETGLELPTRYEIENGFTDSEDFDWQITYAFPRAIRKNVFHGIQYGQSMMTFRRLYKILSDRFNDGEPFIDTYFRTVYVDCGMKDYVDERLEGIKADLLELKLDMFSVYKYTKKGKLDKRASRINASFHETLNEWDSFKADWERNEGVELAREIKEDIIDAVRSGRVPFVKQILSEGTLEVKYKLGFENPESVFYASSQLINSIKLHVNIGGKDEWQTVDF